MIRAFVAVPIDPEMARKISEVQNILKGSLTDIRWVGTENIHLTLKFLGAIAEEKIEPIVRRLEPSLGSISSFAISGRGIGVFPDIRRARVLWVGLEGNSLVSLAREVEEALEPAGFAREKREFRPHLTIGRWRSFNGPAEALRQAIARWQGYDFGSTCVKEIVLFQSITKPEGATYVPLQVMRLNSQTAR